VLEVYIDGASRGNPGTAAAGFIVIHPGGEEPYRHGRVLGRQTNNFAEYTALLDALRYLNDIKRLSAEDIIIHSDSELLVRQLNGTYRVRSSRLKPLYEEAKRMLAGRKNIRITHVNREKNREADRIVNVVLDGGDVN